MSIKSSYLMWLNCLLDLADLLGDLNAAELSTLVLSVAELFTR